jgi:hypothetical protein
MWIRPGVAVVGGAVGGAVAEAAIGAGPPEALVADGAVVAVP